MTRRDHSSKPELAGDGFIERWSRRKLESAVASKDLPQPVQNPG